MTESGGEAYREQRRRDWAAFAGGSGPLVDYWARWEQRSFGWKVPVDFLQPFGLDHGSVFAPIEPLLDELRGLRGIEVPPLAWLHTSWLRVGFLHAADLLWSDVESCYVSAAPRLRRVSETTVHLGGVSVAGDERVYVGVDDGGMYRAARQQAARGSPKIYGAMRDDPLVTSAGDAYVPVIDIAFFTGGANRALLAGALGPYVDVELGDVRLTHLKMARVPIEPERHYEGLEIIAEIPMLGAEHRGGYHD